MLLDFRGENKWVFDVGSRLIPEPLVLGEVPLVPPMAAIANAIYHAIGKRMPDLPITPDRMVAALYDDVAMAAG